MKHSIRLRLMLILTGLIALAVFFCWLMNLVFLGNYYQVSKVNTFGAVYDEVNKIFNESDENTAQSEEEVALAIEKLGANQDLSLYVVDMYYNNLLPLIGFLYPSAPTRRQEEQIGNRMKEYMVDEEGRLFDKEKELLASSKNYNIYKVFDERIQSNYIELFGTLDNHSYIYIKANYESMKESAGIANKFLAYMGIVVMIGSMVIMFFVSESFTKPIKELSGIAKRMTCLDFNAKYMEKRQDEVGELGNSINILSDRLEHTISELKSANNELKQDIEQKTQIDEMRKEFLSNVSHELKTPIALIQGYAEGLRENISEDPESREFYCEVIIDEAAKMNQMVKKLLSLNQIEFGSAKVQFERFDITALIKGILESTAILFEQKKATVIMEETKPIYVWADEYRIEEVITNYISNALNHLDGENVIEVKLITEAETVRVIVFNTGDTIPEDELDQIWIKFYKVDKARTREYGGSGIGLSIVKAIMNSMNQQFGVRNRHNGVEFWFELDRENE